MLEIMNVRFLGVQRRKTSRDNWSCALINSKPQHPASPPSGKPWPFELLRLACSSPSTPSHQGTFNTRFLLARLVYINDTFDNSFEALFECDIRSQRRNPVLKNVLTPQNKEQHQKINPIQIPHPSRYNLPFPGHGTRSNAFELIGALLNEPCQPLF